MNRSRRPLYLRLLRVRHLNLRPGTTLVLFEGSIALGILLSLADVVQPWAVLAVPAAVGVMVKLQDVIAGVFIRPLALAQLRTPRPRDGSAVGRSPIPRPSYPTAAIEADDAVADRAATPFGSADADGEIENAAETIRSVPGEAADGSPLGRSDDIDRAGGAARGVAAVPRHDLPAGRRPMPGASESELPPIPSEDSEPPRPDGADGRSRGNQGRFAS